MTGAFGPATFAFNFVAPAHVEERVYAARLLMTSSNSWTFLLSPRTKTYHVI
jgi:hypothetical protein